MKDKSKTEKPEKNQKKVRAYVKTIVAVFLVVCTIAGLCLWFFVFKKTDEGYEKYYNTFTFENFEQAHATSNLSEKTTVYSYNSSAKTYTTQREYPISKTESKTLYGLASEKEEYIQPIYIKILQIKGDYAIVARAPSSALNEVYSAYIDIIRYRGEEGTPYSLMDGKSVVYSETNMLIPKFVGDYLVTYETIDDLVVTPTFATFYEYKSHKRLLEKFRVRKVYDKNTSMPYTYVQFDDYLAASYQDGAYFYDLNSKIIGGYLEPTENGTYVAFPDFDEVALASYLREMNVYYMGNGWFARTARLYDYKPWNGFNLLIIDGLVTEYSRTKTDFFNVKTGVTKSVDIDYIAGVANRYTYDDYAEKAFLMGTLATYDSDKKAYEYNLPFYNPAAIIKDGYSIVYHYIQPYHETYAGDETNFLGYQGETSILLFSETLEITEPKNTPMPVLFTDGVGLMTSDPIYSELKGTAYAYDKNLDRTVLASFMENSESYYAFFANRYACILQQTRKVGQNDDVTTLYGAVTPDGKRITDFIYDEMTFFDGGYCIAGKLTENGIKYYRVDSVGVETELTDVERVFQGVYSYKAGEKGEKVGLKNYAGEVLIEAVKGTILVSTDVQQDGVLLKTVAAVTVGDVTTFYQITGKNE